MAVIGRDLQTGAPVELTPDGRREGTYLIGAVGAGKTTLLKSIAVQDMHDPTRPGLCVIDPHGDAIDDLLLAVPAHRKDDVVLFAPGDDDQMARPLGLNLLACDRRDDKQVGLVTSTVMSTLHKLFAYSWGPRLEEVLRHAILTLMETPDTTFLDLWLLLSSPKHRFRYTRDLSDDLLRQYWQVQFANYTKRDVVEVVGSSLNKVSRFLTDRRMRYIIAQPRNAFDLSRLMDEGKILLVNLSKGDLGEDNAALLGAVLVNLILIGALRRRAQPREKRRAFHVLVDEYQNMATESFATLQSEARKFNVDLIVAHQYRDQLDDLNKGSTLNVGNFIVLRATGRDGMELASQFDNTPPTPEKVMQPVYRHYDGGPRVGHPLFTTYASPDVGTLFREVELPRRLYTDVQAETANDLTTQPRFQATCRLVDAQGNPAEHVVRIDTSLFTQPGDPHIAAYIRQRSASLGTPRLEVERMIARTIGGALVFDDISPVEMVEDADDDGAA